MTANAIKGDRERYLSLGMNDYIPKPIRMERLVEVLRAAKPESLRTSYGAQGNETTATARSV
jgi:CheY-like chemotaxis protein